MRIYPCYSNTFLQKKRPQSKFNPTPFGAHYDTISGLQICGEGIRYKLGNILNYTLLFRNLCVFKELPSFLESTYPNGVKIHDYACSTGHEACSLVIGLLDALPNENVQKYLPILAFDNNLEMLRIAESHTLKLNDTEKRHLRYFENTNVDDFLKRLRRTSDRQEIYKMTSKLSGNIQFNYGDIFEDLKTGELSKEPCVVLFRNAWQFLTPEGKKELAQSLYKNLPTKSSVIIGDVDIGQVTDPTDWLLIKAGFKRIKPTKLAAFNNKNAESKYLWLRENNDLATFCFIKP